MEEKISVIVPIYNVGEYLRQCVNSICSQTYENLEIILVNDCSTDNSYEICLDYAEKDERVKIVNKEVNEGTGCARISGIEASTGEYIAWVDGDDRIAANMYTELMNIIKEYDADIIQCKYYLAYDHSLLQKHDTKEVKVYDTESALKSLLMFADINTLFWNKIFKRELFDKVSLSRYRYGLEDSDSLYLLIAASNKIICFDKTFCFYRQRGGSLDSGMRSLKKASLMLEIEEKQIEYFKLSYPDLAIFCKLRAFKRLSATYYALDNDARKNGEFTSHISAKIANLYHEVKLTVSLRERCFYFLLMFSSKRNPISRIACTIIRKFFARYGYKYSKIQKQWQSVEDVRLKI